MGKENREYRSFLATQFVDESTESEPYTVRGYFTTFEDPYQLYVDWDGNPVYEVIDRHALDGADMSDVIMQYDHKGMVLARQRNNSLEVGTDDHGAWCKARLGGCQASRDLFEGITNGLVDQMSFGFIVAPDGFEWDSDTRTSRIVRITKVFDVSAVSIPANPGTEIHARSYLDGVIEAERQELSRRERDERARLAALLRLAQV